MITLLSAALGVASVLASDEFVMKRTIHNSALNVDEEQYLLVKPLGRKKLFGEVEWNPVRGTPLSWQFSNNKIQVLGAFKKKNLCLFWKGNDKSPFAIKACDGMFDNQSMRIGCTGLLIGKFEYSSDGDKANPDKMKGGFFDQDGNSICAVDNKDQVPANNFDPEAFFDAQPLEVQDKLFPLWKNEGGQDYWFSLRMKPHFAGQLKTLLEDPLQEPSPDNPIIGVVEVEGNKKINMYSWERHVSKQSADAAVFRWNGKQIEVVYPEEARIDGKPICLEMGKTNKMGLFPYKVQKCDKTVDRGNFDCSGALFGTAWNVKRYGEAVVAGDAAKIAFHLDKLDSLTFFGHSICDYK